MAPIKIRPRAAHSCCVVGSKLYIFGGLTCPTGKDEDLEYLDQLLVFDMLTCTWSLPPTKGSCPSARAGHSVTVFGNNMYIFGGRKGAVLLHDIYQLNTGMMKKHVLTFFFRKDDLDQSFPPRYLTKGTRWPYYIMYN